MHILLTNDDGYFAPGLQTLYEVLSECTDHDVSIVAPEGQRSATGHSITLFNPLFVTEYPLRDPIKGFAISGTPSDCVKLAVQGELIPKPDLLISGINQGSNLGTDIFYSGTVSAAMEGVLLGIPSIAVSLASFEYKEFKPAANYLVENLDRFLKLEHHGLLNLNIPGKPREEWGGLKVTRLGKAVYENIFEKRTDPRGRVYFWQSGSMMQDYEDDTDLRAIQEDYVSITPVHSDLTDFDCLSIWKELLVKTK
ncbi:5'-nucleotidase, exopolyphosphatase, 3'-nucleotidase [Desulfosporosinus acidiphilus SJ4]|uniref:5'-nucleotidase SurE n=1 Tax=Desulfosporosinus acidiphilus (strain DSM 22704 / JCM 16185 / SJ4) TaxID=646529 RepID=I4D848_DESAJ|nr:5'/3'-nucleotidase SurE [Desulfosporosinus acidiphilus]AFM41972.1 5'-nucleotidase, exopolyphosphatase, 3'-nucleotidase [Desulfosporosinus acidiphilus SJ4]